MSASSTEQLETTFSGGLGAPETEWVHPESTLQRLDAGRKLRERLPRSALAEISEYTRDPLRILAEQNETRLQDLVPLRAERMSQSAFTFYRGTAGIMAADLAASPHTNLLVPSCGDAHLSNFGFYASPQRTLVFDLNDFDEAAWAPWDWDLKRLIGSIVIAGQATSRDEEVVNAAVLSTVREYARALRNGVGVSPLVRYYAHLDVETSMRQLPPASKRVLKKAIKQAKKRTGERAVDKLTTTTESGRKVFLEFPPTMTHLSPERASKQRAILQRYADTANPDIQLLLRNYTVSDRARRVVGVGSVGTRCSLHLLQDGDENALILQAKEAGPSVLAQYGGIKQPRRLQHAIEQHGEGARVVALQRVLQALSDPFLGFLRDEEVDLYVRQFHDMKGGLEAETLDDEPFRIYAQACGVILARAHLQSPFAAVVSGYVGRGGALGKALLEWGYAYADLAKQDYESFLRAEHLAARLPN